MMWFFPISGHKVLPTGETPHSELDYADEFTNEHDVWKKHLFLVTYLDLLVKGIRYILWSVAKANEVIIVHDAECQGVSKAIEEFHTFSKHVVNQTNISSGPCIVAVLNIPARSG